MRIIGRPKQPRPVDPAVEVPLLPSSDGFSCDPQRPPLLVLSGCRWTATGGGQRPVQIARAWRAMGHEVVYASAMDKPSTSEEGVIVTHISDVRDHYPQLMRMTSLAFCGFPQLYQYMIGLRNWFRVLDVCDDWAEFYKAGLLPDTMWSQRAERVACLDAHVTTYSAASLGHLAEEFGAEHRLLVPNAGPAAPIVCEEPPANLLRGTVTAVFCGCLWGSWLDWPALTKLAQDLLRTGGVINIIGGMEAQRNPEEVPNLPNIRYHGTLPFPEAMRYVAACDVGLIPFRGEGICRAVDPIKYYDYAACGLPTVATNIMRELRGRPYVTLAKPQELSVAVERAARGGRLPAAQVAAFCAEHSWAARAKMILATKDIPGVWWQ